MNKKHKQLKNAFRHKCGPKINRENKSQSETVEVFKKRKRPMSAVPLHDENSEGSRVQIYCFRSPLLWLSSIRVNC